MNQIRVKLFLTIFCLLSINSLGIAQNMDHPGPPPAPSAEQLEKMVDELGKELSLSTEQKVAIIKVHQDHQKAMKAKMGKKTKQRPDEATMQASRKELDEKIMALLSEEQKTGYLKFMKEHKPPHGGGPGGRPRQ